MTQHSSLSDARRDPATFKRRVLLCVAGLSPQVVTEALYALAVANREAPWIPTEIHVITTQVGAQQARLSLLAPDRDQFGRLCRDYGLPPIAFDASSFTVIEGADEKPLQDISTPADNEAAGDAILRVVARYAADPNCAIHASIAGGRKTMGFFLGYAMSLCGRPQDRLSHVLVTEQFEGHRDFFYPPRQPVTLQSRDGREISTADARIMLAEIPFILLRGGLPFALQDGLAGYAETVRAYRPNAGDETVVVDTDRGVIGWRGQAIELTPTEMAVYTWLAERRIMVGEPEPMSRRRGDAKRLHREFRKVLENRFHEFGRAANAAESMAQAVRDIDDLDEWLAPHRTRINRKIQVRFGRTGVEAIGIRTVGRNKDKTFELAVPAAWLRIVPDKRPVGVAARPRTPSARRHR
jgi:CRISPR-associated protein (TIGR02584 family)